VHLFYEFSLGKCGGLGGSIGALVVGLAILLLEAIYGELKQASVQRSQIHCSDWGNPDALLGLFVAGQVLSGRLAVSLVTGRWL